MSDYIPEEVLVHVLKSVPAKTVLRLRCVCKSWKSLISSPHFVSMHTHHASLSKSPTPDDRMLVRRYCKHRRTERYSVYHENEDFTEENEVKIFFPLRQLVHYYLRIVDYSNGLLCLSDDILGCTDLIILWNPFIKRKITLPLPRASCKNFGPSMYSLLGFGYDIKNGDFKVVRIAYAQQSHGDIMPSIAEVFALSVGYWRVIAANLPQAVIPHFWTQAFVNGKVHWVAYRFNTDNAFVCESPLNLCNSVCEDAISVLHYDGHIGTRIWLMKEYGDVNSWSKMYTVCLEGGLGRILSFRNAGDILLTARDGKLYSYDPRIQEIKYLGILGTRDSFFVGRYSESLALLIEGEQALEGLPNAAESNACKEDNEGEFDEMHIVETLNNACMVHFVIGLLEE